MLRPGQSADTIHIRLATRREQKQASFPCVVLMSGRGETVLPS
jgi:hypothetical protein